ncbi:E3 ubiquitin-protein ligase rnf213-alpha-like isoform X2 [Electrophorus electricus]|uniref:E3 ubiquitin-protein ligase rnf213-alpha-like isoform X2 n=1 Tax=Electrophorus electricus TaxID=8005 RepID=UPI0015D078F7|nr:E3 ubiquitin-protein ligase rnf213-alpha-like isoform X2 [Electrophorus electricus]
MKCQCGCSLKACFKFCPECGQRLPVQLGDSAGKSQREQTPIVPPSSSDTPSETSPELQGGSVKKKVISDPCLSSSLDNTHLHEGDNATETTTGNGSSVVVQHVPPNGNSLSSPTATEENIAKSVCTSSQNTQSSSSTHVLVQDTTSVHSPSTASMGLPSIQVLPRNESKDMSGEIIGLESEHSSQSSPVPLSASEASSKPSEECEKEVHSCSSEPEAMSCLNPDSLTPSPSPSKQNNDMQSVQSAMLDSPVPLLIKDQNGFKLQSHSKEAVKEMITSQMQGPALGSMPPTDNGTTKVPDQPYEDLDKAQSANLNQESSIPPRRFNSQTSEQGTEKPHTLQCTTGQGETSKNKNDSNKKVFGPYPTEREVPKSKTDNIQSKQQTHLKESKVENKQTNAVQSNRGTESVKHALCREKPLSEGKRMPSDQNDDAAFQQVSSKKKKESTSNPQEEPKDITVIFHAILSKDFKLDPSKDFVTIRSGSLAENWNKDILTMEITRDLGQNGFIVHGKLQTTKKNVGKFIPYKYVVNKEGKNKNSLHTEYEHIYTEEAKHIVNRCLFIKGTLLTQEGEWHQYDDIICARPPDGMKEKFKSWFTNIKPDLVKGRIIAGNEMLETIFDILHEWNKINLRNFFSQLQQFFTTYSNPYVYEDKAKPWQNLQYGKEEVKKLFKSFMHWKLYLQQTDRHSLKTDPLKAAITFLLVSNKYDLMMGADVNSKIGWMLCLPELSKERFRFYWDEFFQPLQEERVADAVRKFCETAINQKTTTWILIIPLLHLLEGDSKPFEPNSLAIGQEFDVWAGLKRFRIPDVHVTDSQHTRALMKVMESCKHLLHVDQLLARSWMRVLGLNNLLEFTCMFSVDTLDVLFMISKSLDINMLYISKENLKMLLSHLICKTEGEKYRFKDCQYDELCLKTAITVLVSICTRFKEPCHYEVPMEYLKLLSLIIGSTCEQESTEAQRNRSTEGFYRMIRIVREWLRKTFSNRLLSSTHSYTTFSNTFEMEVWSQLLSLTFADKEFCATWRQEFLNQFEGKLKQEKPTFQIEIYCNKVENIAVKFPVLSSCLEKCALEAVSSICQGGSESDLFEKLKSHDLSKFGLLVSTIVLKAWPKTEDGKYLDGDELVVKHLLTWRTATRIFQLQGANGRLIDQLSDNAREKMAVASSVFSCVAEKFFQGNITIKMLNHILEGEDAFFELLKIDGLCDDGRCKDHRAVKTLLRRRKEEVEKIYHEKEMVACLLRVCHTLQKYINVDTKDLENTQQNTVEDMLLDDFMEVHQFDQSSSEVTGMVTYFNLCDITRKMAKSLHDLQESYIFAMCWENQAQKLSNIGDNDNDDDYDDDDPEPKLRRNMEQCTLEFIYTEVFEPCYVQYETIYTRLKSGTITFQEVDSAFKAYMGKYTDFRKDLEIMCKINPKDDKRWIKRRIQQIQQYHDLHLAVESAQVIVDVMKVLCPMGNFQILDRLLHASEADFKEETLDHIDDNLISAKEVVADITEARRLCLQELGHRRNLVEWVKEALKDISQLTVFVDLATISAGENAMDVDRVACFHDAVLGYSSMLYGLNADSDFDAFKRALQKLWQALENDSNITKKLRDTARHLDWLKTVKESHGSVELSSISLVKAINTRGVYTISAQYQTKINMDTALRLDVPEEHGEGQESRHYVLEDVRDLQNKLMLMSGKGEQSNEVEHFTEVFDHVQRLAGTFLDMLSAGNPLFRHWEAKIICSDAVLSSDHHSNSGIILNFNLSSIPYKILEAWNLVHADLQNVGTANSVSTDRSLNTSLQDISDKVFGLGTLDMIWEKYVTDMKTFLPDVLEIPNLARLLGRLNSTVNLDSEDEDQEELLHLHPSKRPIRRVLPKGLVNGRPNLIVCPREEVLATCISIYSVSEYEPLPTYDEVLLCSAATPYEHVELFLRRCLSSGCMGEKIYCLLHADLLNYEVSYAVEQLFHRLHSGSKKDFKLVIICSSEHAYIPSAFGQFKLHMIPRESLEGVQAYLSKHYTVPSDLPSAAAVFKDKQSVGIVSSERAGVGKSLYVQRLYEKLEMSERPGSSCLRCIRLIEPTINEISILQSLLDTPNKNGLVIFHLDVTTSVQKGLDEFLFKLLVLGYLMDTEGHMWKRSSQHLYVIEMLQHTTESPKFVPRVDSNVPFTFTEVFPRVKCRPPKEVLELEIKIEDDPSFEIEDPLMDDEHFRSEAYQRPYQYLKRFYEGTDLDNFTFIGVEGSHKECLQMMFLYCGIVDPSWTELRNFIWFLNLQLKDCETSIFCNMEIVGDTLGGFRKFVVDFMILMAKDFATPSLNISDQSPGRQTVDLIGVNEEDLAPFHIRKRWESEPHPYIFFNDDHESMTFIGFHLRLNNQKRVDAIDPSSNKVIRKNIMTKELYDGLQLNRVPFNINFDDLSRGEKIEYLCSVLGVKWPSDPDETYQLTTDNILKMMAIHMRFRCGIPVIIMGETGCGKTRLIKFLCELQRSGTPADNMKLVKVHGGTTPEIIYANVQEAEAIASLNKEKHELDSVIFFDEANTTEAIGCIKEVLCDHTVQGHKLKLHTGLHVIAACNPYRKHSDVMIERLEGAGLGYVVKADQTQDRLGSIPLRQLVYRVHALPPSMIPLVWDFGQLNDDTEELYIHQIVRSVVENNSIQGDYMGMMTNILSVSQHYMRKRKDECSFVSLRDVERCMQVFVWFYTNYKMFFEELQELLKKKLKQSKITDEEDRDPVEWALLMAVTVCYNSCLEKKKEFWTKLCRFFPNYNKLANVVNEISLIQDLLLHDVPFSGTIAKNKALKENVFMMVVCIELRIPLFLVGKPGSSKSLSKTLVADAMQGQAAHSEFYKNLKQVHLTSYQCSPHSTAEGIINTFKQCARFQEGKNLKEYVSVVVLDEIGLAEDSPKMPLKTLHPLLEEGCTDDDPLPHKKVGFIGISNWALDPAKMNRGIFVSRGDPDENELILTAAGICSLDPMVLGNIRHIFCPLAGAYLEICKTQDKGFFGLRDYYSLIKMIYAVSKSSSLSSEEIVNAVLRNFSGLDNVDTLNIFSKKLDIRPDLDSISTINLVGQNINGITQDEDCRYLLILTKNFAGLQILQQNFFSDNNLPEIIFGSSFPKDQEYTQVCKNINRVKICMETGQAVVLLNLQNLYESLYDALNQYYVFLGGLKYVDLGLGTHRVKCRVHKDFRLIVIEEKEVVYKQFPIPLINRLEKHYIDINSVLNSNEKEIVKCLQNWVQHFVSPKSQHCSSHKYLPPDVFIGYHSDTCSSVVLQVIDKLRDETGHSDIQDQVLEEAKIVLLNCATPDSVVRLEYTDLPDVESERLLNTYFKVQRHHSLAEFIGSHIQQGHWNHYIFTEVTTFSRLLTAVDVVQLQSHTGIHNMNLLSLRQFETEFSFLKKIRQFLGTPSANKILLLQIDFSEDSGSANILASARYSCMNEIIRSKPISACKVFVYFITKLQRIEGGTSYTGFQGGHWTSVHIDDLRSSQDIVSDVQNLRNISICDLFKENKSQYEEMEVQDPMLLQSEFDKSVLESMFDTTVLLRSCVQNAVSMLRDPEDGGTLSTRRVEILLRLMDNSDQLKVSFMETLKKRLHLLLKTREDNADMPLNWVTREASNIEALQEGGTFKHALWRRVQTVVTPFLAHLISFIDRNCNLDLLLDSDCKDEVKDMWLLIFGEKAMLDIPYIPVGQSLETPTIQIQSHISVGRTVSCTMPFSWRIKDLLDDLWVYTLQREGQSHRQFEGVFKRTVLGEYFASVDKEMQREFFQRYLQDFIALTMKVSSVAEQQLLCAALASCVNELCTRRGISVENKLSLPLVHSAYHEFRKGLQNFSRMMSILPQVALSLQGNPHVMGPAEMILDVYGALACVEQLEPQDLNGDFQRQSWLKQVKRLQVPIELVCSERSLKHYSERSREMVKFIHTAWRRIFTLSLFVEHILLGIEREDERLTPLVMEHTRNIGRVLEKNPDMKLEKTFGAVIEILRSCKQRASDLIFKYGLQSCAICRTEPQDPVELPCNHIFCQSCIKRWLIPGQMYCAMCTQPVPDDFQLNVSEDVRTCFKLNAQFRQRCNAFFVEVVSTVCFKDNSPPSRGVILHLLSFLMVEAKPASLTQMHSRILTKALSPFDECVDRNPIVRSMVLKLLLKYSFDDVKDYLEHHLTDVLRSKILDDSDKSELYTLYINCFEDSMFEKKHLGSGEEQKLHLQEGRDFLHYFLHTGRVDAEQVSIEALQQIARLRLYLDMGAQMIATLPHNGSLEKHQTEFLDTVMELCGKSGNDWYRVYLIRKICSLHGVEFVRSMQKEVSFRWLFPQEILQQEEVVGQVDQYLVYGEEYKTVREAIAKAVFEGRVQSIDAALEKCTCSPRRRSFYILLALFQEVTTLFRASNPVFHPKPEQCRALEVFVRGSQHLSTSEMKAFAEALVNNTLGSLSVHMRHSNMEHTLTELAVHLKAVLLCGSDGLLHPLTQLGLSPSTMQAAFIPTMPEDMFATARKALGFTWYTCPNGHPCVVDKCGQPTQLGRCLECGATVGGQNHLAVHGFRRTQQMGDRTQRGHILGDPQRRDNPEALDTKSLSLTPFTLIRMLTHLTMLLGATEQPQSIAHIIRPPVQDPCGFLMQHLAKDLEQLSRAVGKGADETVTAAHLLLSWALEPPQSAQWTAGYDNTLSTKEARNAWEVAMAQNIITPKLKKLERKLQKVGARMRDDSRVSSDPILKLMYGDPRLFLSSVTQSSVVHSSAVWSCREGGSLLSLMHVVEQNDGKDNFPLLWRFLQKEPELRLVRFLPDILALQRNLVKKFQNLPDLISGTIRDFLDKQNSASLKSWYLKRIQIFLNSWNQLRTSLVNFEVKVPDDYCSIDLDEGSELQVLVPRRQGAGLCATALLSYLISLHNQLVSTAEEHTGEDCSYKVSLAEVSELHVIGYEVERDLLPLVVANCQYSVERGRETLSEYDLPKIQQQVLGRLLRGKPQITLAGIPTLVSRQDRNYENIFKDIREKVTQEPLMPLISSGLVTELQGLSDVCEALGAIEVALGFLAMTGGDEHMPLEDYLERRLQMGHHTAPHVLKALGRCCLNHCVALWQLLTSLKSEHMLRLKRDPFSGIPAEYQQALGDDAKQLLSGFLSQSRADAWLLEMHEFLLLCLKSQQATDTFRPDWSLKDTLVSYMERKNLDIPLDVEAAFPDQIQLSQLVETWKFTITHKQQR